MPDFDIDSAFEEDPLKEFACPDGLSETGHSAWLAIVSLLQEKDDLKSGGHTKVFYSPEEWRARGEEGGQGSVLIVVHDGGNHACYFNSAYESYSAIAAQRDVLRMAGCHNEPCSSWYSAVYKD